jgi:hypothetical protein
MRERPCKEVKPRFGRSACKNLSQRKAVGRNLWQFGEASRKPEQSQYSQRNSDEKV